MLYSRCNLYFCEYSKLHKDNNNLLTQSVGIKKKYKKHNI